MSMCVNENVYLRLSIYNDLSMPTMLAFCCELQKQECYVKIFAIVSPIQFRELFYKTFLRPLLIL